MSESDGLLPESKTKTDVYYGFRLSGSDRVHGSFATYEAAVERAERVSEELYAFYGLKLTYTIYKTTSTTTITYEREEVTE